MPSPDTDISPLPTGPGPIGVFDSGYGGLTVLKSLRQKLSSLDYLYLGDNARAPYGTRSFEMVYQYTRQAVEYLFRQGCQLVILACNTASAKALRTIQQHDLPTWDPQRRVLGVIRPTAEIIGDLTHSRHVGILATPGTILSHSYDLEIKKLHPDIRVTGLACPMWVPLIENFELDNPGTDYFVKKYIDQILAADSRIDTLILGCTHYPILLDRIRHFVPQGITIVPQGRYVADSLADYLQRHPDMAQRITRQGQCRYLTTEDPFKFAQMGRLFLQSEITARHIQFQGE